MGNRRSLMLRSWVGFLYFLYEGCGWLRTQILVVMLKSIKF